MIDIQECADNLCLFNNRTFTKKQWNLIFKACGCPKTPLFWTLIKNSNMVEDDKYFTLVDLNIESLTEVIRSYREYANNSSKKSYRKKKAREKVNNTIHHVYYMVNGVLTTEKPERDI